jgi:hypothetical protein
MTTRFSSVILSEAKDLTCIPFAEPGGLSRAQPRGTRRRDKV